MIARSAISQNQRQRPRASINIELLRSHHPPDAGLDTEEETTLNPQKQESAAPLMNSKYAHPKASARKTRLRLIE